MARDLKEARQHKEAFNAFTVLVEGEHPELVVTWRKWVLQWESEQHTDGYASPFEFTKSCTSSSVSNEAHANTYTQLSKSDAGNSVAAWQGRTNMDGGRDRSRATTHIEHLYLDGARH